MKNWIQLLFAIVFVPLVSSQETDQDVALWDAEIDKRLTESLDTYRSFQESIAEEKVPLVREINALEVELIDLRREVTGLKRSAAQQQKGLNDLKANRTGLRGQNQYLSGLMTEYLNTFEGRLHIAEDQKYEDTLEALRQEVETLGPDVVETVDAKAQAIALGFERLESVIGGYEFEGRAIDVGGELVDGKIFVYGPAGYFLSQSEERSGLLSFQSGALEPALIELDRVFKEAIQNYNGVNSLPLDATLGKAVTLSEAAGSMGEHLRKGGPVGFAIIAMGLLALALAVFKLFDLQTLAVAMPANLLEIASIAVKGDKEAAVAEARKAKGWMGEMLSEGANHVNEDRDLMEDHMLSVILHKRPQLERFLPWLAVTAAATPLMGLLGTVVGMIKTFTLITIFGTGDPKALSSGISEALITTELGLIVAIPTLVIHGALLRLAKKRVSSMELAATEFSKIVSKVAARAE